MLRPISRALSLLVICGALAEPMVVDTQQAGSPQAEPAARTEVLRFAPRINTLDELKPKTAEELARARAFNDLGGSPLVAGMDSFYHVDRAMRDTPRDETPTYWEVMDALACSAPVIVVARPTARRVRMNETGTFLFTEYGLAVSRWIVQNMPVPDSGLELLIAGGEVTLGNRRIATFSGVPFLRNTDYILFLRRAPNSTAFLLRQTPIPSQSPWDVVLPFRSLPLELKANLVAFETFAVDLDTAAHECKATK